MNQNEKVARELIRIAKQLTADNNEADRWFSDYGSSFFNKSKSYIERKLRRIGIKTVHILSGSGSGSGQQAAGVYLLTESGYGCRIVIWHESVWSDESGTSDCEVQSISLHSNTVGLTSSPRDKIVDRFKFSQEDTNNDRKFKNALDKALDYFISQYQDRNKVATSSAGAPEKDWIVARKLQKVLPNEEALYTEIWNSGRTVRNVHLTWYLDGDPKKLEFDTRK